MESSKRDRRRNRRTATATPRAWDYCRHGQGPAAGSMDMKNVQPTKPGLKATSAQQPPTSTLETKECPGPSEMVPPQLAIDAVAEHPCRTVIVECAASVVQVAPLFQQTKTAQSVLLAMRSGPVCADAVEMAAAAHTSNSTARRSARRRRVSIRFMSDR